MTTWTAGRTLFPYTTLFRSLSGANFDVQSDSSLTCISGGCTFSNAGTFTKPETTGLTTCDTVFSQLAFSNSDSVTVQSGKLSLASSATTSGSFAVAAGATLN